MELKKVVGKLKPDEVAKFNSVLKVLKYTQSGIIIKNLVTTDKKSFVEVSFEVNTESYNIIIEKLALNRINLELNDEASTKIIEEANQQLERGKNKNTFLGWNGAPTEKKKLTVEHITSDGNYEELIKISRDVSATKEDVAKAVSKIDSAINNAMEKAYSPAIQDPYYAEQGFNRLLQIAGDSNLSLINKNEFRFKAGIQAVNICVKHKDQNVNLVTICNNAKIDNLVSATAAVRLAGIINESSYNNNKVLDVVLKELNIKWLDSIFDGVSHKFAEKEIKDFKKLIKYVEDKRE
ncbi:MAG: hypothetical protein KJ571_17920 [Bacteroidetes bacterium]|nr:hypothetical protein [Bacteroidota bacterium]